MAAKKKTGATRKPARSRTSASPRPSARDSRFGLVIATALRGIVNMAIVSAISGTVLGTLLAVRYFGA